MRIHNATQPATFNHSESELEVSGLSMLSKLQLNVFVRSDI
jgi:hypothetical protein